MLLRPTIQRWSLNRSVVLRSHGLLFHSLCEGVSVRFAGHPCFSGRPFNGGVKDAEGLRSHIFGIQDHAPHSCSILTSDSRYSSCYSSSLTGCPWQAFSYHRCSSYICIQVFSHCVADHLSLANNSLLQMHPLLANIIDQDHRIIRIQSPSRISPFRAISSKPYLSDIAIRLVQPSIYIGPLSLVSPHAIDSITPLSSDLQFVSSASRVLEVSHIAAIPHRRRPLNLRHEP